jgi:hypothetical protein
MLSLHSGQNKTFTIRVLTLTHVYISSARAMDQPSETKEKFHPSSSETQSTKTKEPSERKEPVNVFASIKVDEAEPKSTEGGESAEKHVYNERHMKSLLSLI